MGRPSHQPTDETRERVKTLAGYGIPHDDIARLIGVSDVTMRKHYRAELDVGHAAASAEVIGALYKNVMRGDTTAAIWWTKVRCGWRAAENSDQSGGNTVVFNTVVEKPSDG